MTPILCIGSVGVDILAWPFDTFPISNQLSLVKQIQQGVGGCAANVSTVMARLGANVTLVGRVGMDFAGEYSISQLRNDGVDVSSIVLDDKEQTGTAIVFVSQDGARSFIYTAGANSYLQEANIPDNELSRFGFIHFSDVFLLPKLDGSPAVRLLKKAKDQGLITSLDTSWDPSGRWMTLLREYLPHLDFFFTNLDEASNLLPELEPFDMVSKLIELGVRTVILKMGSEGCIVGHSLHEPFLIAPNKISPVDTTGAGDTFVAAFICGFLEGMSYRHAAIAATRLAEDCILSLGATSGIRCFSSAYEMSKHYNIKNT